MMRLKMRSSGFAAASVAALMLAACDPVAPPPDGTDTTVAEDAASTEPRQDREPVSPTPPEVKTRATPSGPPVTVEAEEEEGAQWAASVMQIHPMESQNAKIFATAGGDPAINGLYTYLGLFGGAAEGWRVFRIGDFESWRVIDEADGRVVLEVAESSINSDTGLAMTRRKRVIVRFNADEPENITVTPAA